jgi:hypothetical protein
MPTQVEWIEKPHIIQITYQGKLTLAEVAEGGEQIIAMHLADKAQPKLYEYLDNCFQAVDKLSSVGDYTDCCQTLDRGHERQEQRQCRVLSDRQAQDMGWQDCQTLVCLRRTRQEGLNSSLYTSYYISNYPPSGSLVGSYSLPLGN